MSGVRNVQNGNPWPTMRSHSKLWDSWIPIDSASDTGSP